MTLAAPVAHQETMTASATFSDQGTMTISPVKEKKDTVEEIDETLSESSQLIFPFWMFAPFPSRLLQCHPFHLHLKPALPECLLG